MSLPTKDARGAVMSKKPPTPETVAIGKRIAIAMGSEGKKPETLASELGLTTDSIYRYLRGESLATVADFARLADKLRTTPNALLGISEAADLNSDRIAAALDGAFDGLGLQHPDDRSLLIETVIALAKEPSSAVPGVDDLQVKRIEASGAVRLIRKLRLS